MNHELIYQISLTLVPNIGDVHTKILIQHFGNAASVFRARSSVLEKIEGIGTVRARSIIDFNEFHIAEKEIKFIEKFGIRVLFLTDKDYPQRLLNCYDAPSLLYFKGSADLNTSRILSIVGTRTHTEYGKLFTEKLVKDLATENVLIISGLAFGIDAIAHKSALKNNLITVGVVGHGLDIVYPHENTELAKEIVKHGGGILTEFLSGTKPDKHHFPLRNRIVAGMSDATIVIETNSKGGSMITGKLADAYNRDVFALPGRVTDKSSSGCNHLIQYNKAILLTCAEDLMKTLGWKERKKDSFTTQKALFIDLSVDEKQVMMLLQSREMVHIDELHLQSGLSSSTFAAAVLNLELQNVVGCLPGKMYRLL